MSEYYQDLKLIEPKFGSKLADLIFESADLGLRGGTGLFVKLNKTSIPLSVFHTLQSVFKTIESVASARIEGNHTTISQYISDRHNGIVREGDEGNMEIENISNAIEYIHETFSNLENPRGFSINRLFLSELHQILMNGLSVGSGKEGADTPGSFRQVNVKITSSKHTPPDYTQVQSFMEQLLEFINKDDPKQFDLIKIALAHHRFVWIHPYENGNGRIVRCLTYALLIKYGFDIECVKLLNPSSLFCLDRGKYYQYLEEADYGEQDKLIQRCEYAISGINIELKHLEKFLDGDFVKSILKETVDKLYKDEIIDNDEVIILNLVFAKGYISLKDVESMTDVKRRTAARKFAHLKDLKLIESSAEKTSNYIPVFEGNPDFFMHLYHVLIKYGFTTIDNLDTPLGMEKYLK